MPYFNYCLTISIYFSKSSLQSLCNCYCLCLYKLFKFKVADDPNITNNNKELFNFNSFQRHIIIKLFSLIHKILNNIHAPTLLENQLPIKSSQKN